MSEEIYNKKKASRLHKAKKKPVKVVYISNPVKVETTASHFRALVQQLTGQDSAHNNIPQPSTIHRIRGCVGDMQQDVMMEDEVQKEVVPTRVESGNEMGNGSDLSFQDDDSVFMPQLMMENFNSSFWFESTHV